MTQPYIDCAIRLAERGVRAEDVESIVCDVGEGTVHRLWEQLAVKHRPPTPYAAKFSTPFCMAVGFFDRRAGFGQFTEARIHDPAVLALAGKIRYRIDPENEYPRNFTGHLRATMTAAGSKRCGNHICAAAPTNRLPPAELDAKFADNTRFGGWDAGLTNDARAWCATIFTSFDLAGVARFRR